MNDRGAGMVTGITAHLPSGGSPFSFSIFCTVSRNSRSSLAVDVAYDGAATCAGYLLAGAAWED